MHIGLYFGSFNPIHVGHLIIASYARQYTQLQQVWLVVSPQNPLKHSNTLLNEYHRLHLVNIAIQDDPQLRATDIEFKLPKPSYTIDTLTYLQEKYPMHSFSVIMGSDSLHNLPAWKNYETLLDNYHLYVFERPGFKIVQYPNATIHKMEAPLLQISSTLIRQMIQQGKSIRYLVPPAVQQEIELNNYYK
ncbi:MAG TPA: nicotinate (nicotinamide) nucleotide adenylyltransferase [Phnomibacter sp.]|nr:nicotinate (nicotinamide) nucleotide adenylyltransferase [Phnomibacter sp.]